MRKTSWRIVGALSGLIWLIPQPGSAVPVPEMKPLGSVGQTPFVEGIDIPRTKPRSEPEPEREPEHQDRAGPQPKNAQARGSCVIPGALFEDREPFSGDRAVSPAQDEDEGCGIADPVGMIGVRHGSVEVAFPGPVLLSCDFSKVVADWLLLDVLPAADSLLGTQPVRVGSGPGFQCRRRNNQPDGKLSEHALGKAIDISGFEFQDGTRISIDEDWGRQGVKGRFLKRIHTAACERFTTVLGPEADPNHKSHFHLDIGCHGRDCTYIICQ